MPVEGIWGLHRVIEGCMRFYRLRCFRAETCGVEGAGPQGESKSCCVFCLFLFFYGAMSPLEFRA